MELTNNNKNKKTMDDDKFFIHFNSATQCQDFLATYNGSTGHRCCWGKGCHLPDVKDWKEIHQLKKQFLG